MQNGWNGLKQMRKFLNLKVNIKRRLTPLQTEKIKHLPEVIPLGKELCLDWRPFTDCFLDELHKSNIHFIPSKEGHGSDLPCLIHFQEDEIRIDPALHNM
jgi:hypothetical protein